MSDQLHDRVLAIIMPLAEELRRLQFQPIEAHVKAGEGTQADIATNADEYSDAYLRAELPKLQPNSWVISEETPVDNSVTQFEYTWVVDPLDGTVNYSHHLPLYGVSIALFKGSTLVYGMIYLPALQKYIAAGENKELQFGNAGTDFVAAHNAVPFVTISKSPNATPTEHGLVVQKIGEALRSPRDFGCCVYQAYLALTHHIDCAVMYNVAIWDMAAAMYLADCAGLKTHYWSDPLEVQLSTQSSSHQNLAAYQQTAAIGTAQSIAAMHTIEW